MKLFALTVLCLLAIGLNALHLKNDHEDWTADMNAIRDEINTKWPKNNVNQSFIPSLRPL